MSEATFSNIRVRGVAAAVPAGIRSLADDAGLFDPGEIDKVSASTGVMQRHVSLTLTTADLCQAAAERLLAQTQCAPTDVDALIFVSQTPDYPLPASSCCLQARLGLSSQCAALDVNLGCSGYVYGLWLAAGMIAAGAVKRVLLLVGDTIYRTCSPEDRSVALLFGDAGSATLLEWDASADPCHFVLGTDGTGAPHLQVPAGGYRRRFSPAALLRQEVEGGNRRSAVDLYMNGAEVFAFTLRAVPPLIKGVLARAGHAATDVDYFVFHQANRFMLEHLFKRLKLPPERCVLGLRDYGNTSSASIPLALVTELRDRLQTAATRLVLAGFGVGFSWAGVSLRCGPMVVPEVVLVPEPTPGSEPGDLATNADSGGV